MFRPGNLGHLGRLGLVAASQPSLIAQALAILAKYGSAANLYLPGVGAVSGITAGNWLDSAGTVAATVDNPVGLVLDSTGVLGPELCPNGTFANGATDWSVPAGWALGSGVVTATTTNASLKQISTPCVANKTYQVEFDWTHTSGTLYVRVGTGTATTFNSSGRKSAVLKAASSAGAEFYGGSVSGAIDNISVREISGAHLTQSTAANQPVLRRGLVNQLTQSDFQNGVTDAPMRGGLVTASTLAGYGGALAFGHDGSAISYGYKLFAAMLNTVYTIAFVIRMDDGNPPVFGSANYQDVSNTFAVVLYSNAYSPIGAGGYTVTALTDNTYLVMYSAVATTAASANFGVVKYSTNNNRTFKVTRYGLFTGAVTAQQILAAGGIPLTTTAPASSALGKYWWQFDPTASGDFLQTSITTGNEGWVCAGVNFTDSNSTIVCSGAGSNAQKGIWAYRTASNDAVNMLVGNGTLVSNAVARPMSANAPCVWEGWWTATTVGQAVDGVGAADVARSGDASPPPAPLRIGAYTDGVTYAANGSMSVTVICSTLPTAAERATLRKFIASLSGVTM